ncbi:MAG TPA: GAF domain-containing protein, partial [Nitrospiraceae bacterium]|nr:GAF domain-containing protein [Nitrospiraceae bacterium]
MNDLFSKDHTILEKGFMEHRPFGIDPQGENIRDVSGFTVKANVEYLEETVGRRQGPEAATKAVEKLCQLLNERMRDPAYHVSPTFLTNVWHSYSYEFVCFLGEFCRLLSEDPQFQFHVGKERFISPIMQTLGRPFTVPQIYKMFAHFGEKFAKGSLQFEVGAVTDRSAVLRMKFNERVYQQFGPYRKRCAELICQSSKAALAAVPELVHHLPAATIKDRSCIAEGAEYCEWEFTWPPQQHRRSAWPAWGVLVGGAAFAYLRIRYPEMPLMETLALALFPAMALWLARNWRILRRNVKTGETVIQEQLRFVEARHEELREAYLEQEESTVELRKMISQLTTLHRASLIFSTTLDREALLQKVLETIIHELHYDWAMITLFDRNRQVSHDARILGVSDEIAAFARSLEVPVTDPNSVEGTVLLQGKPILAGNIRDVWD